MVTHFRITTFFIKKAWEDSYTYLGAWGHTYVSKEDTGKFSNVQDL